MYPVPPLPITMAPIITIMEGEEVAVVGVVAVTGQHLGVVADGHHVRNAIGQQFHWPTVQLADMNEND